MVLIGMEKGKGKGTVMSDTFSWATCRSSSYLRSQLFSMTCLLSSFGVRISERYITIAFKSNTDIISRITSVYIHGLDSNEVKYEQVELT